MSQKYDTDIAHKCVSTDLDAVINLELLWNIVLACQLGTKRGLCHMHVHKGLRKHILELVKCQNPSMDSGDPIVKACHIFRPVKNICSYKQLLLQEGCNVQLQLDHRTCSSEVRQLQHWIVTMLISTMTEFTHMKISFVLCIVVTLNFTTKKHKANY